MKISSIHCLSQTVRAIELQFWRRFTPHHVSHIMCHMSCVTCHVSHVMCHMSYVTCHVSHVMCHISCVTCNVSHVMCHMSCVTCHVSHIMCHMSCGTCHMSHVTCHMSHVTCNVSHVTCNVSCVTFYMSHIFCLYFTFLDTMLSQRKVCFLRGLHRLDFLCFDFLFLFWYFTKQLILKITFAASFLLMMGELAGGGSVAVDVAVSVRLQATCVYYPQCPSASLFFFYIKIFSNLF